MIRRARMQHRPALWLPGVDHASIAAQWVLRRVLADEGTTPEELGREKYLERMWRFMDETRPGDHGPAAAPGHLRRLEPRALHHGRPIRARRPRRVQAALRGRPGLSRPEARQLVPGLRHQRVRPRGHRHARGRQASGPSGTTCCRQGPSAGAAPSPDETITVATTRPETILGDTAVAVHPDDERYARAGRPHACASPSSTATCPSWPTSSWSATSAPAP